MARVITIFCSCGKELEVLPARPGTLREILTAVNWRLKRAETKAALQPARCPECRWRKNGKLR